MFDLGVEPRDLAQEGRAVIGQRVLDLVPHRQLPRAQQPGLPELGDPGPHLRGIAFPLARIVERLPFGQQVGQRMFGVEKALALHLGRVCGQNRRDPGVLQGLRHLRLGDPRLGEPFEALGEAAVLMAGRPGIVRVLGAAAQPVAVFGDVGEMREIRERADHRHGLRGREPDEQLFQAVAGARIVASLMADAQPPDVLDDREGALSLVVADHVAEHAPEQANVVDQRLVLGRVADRLGGFVHGVLSVAPTRAAPLGEPDSGRRETSKARARATARPRGSAAVSSPRRPRDSRVRAPARAPGRARCRVARAWRHRRGRARGRG